MNALESASAVVTWRGNNQMFDYEHDKHCGHVNNLILVFSLL